MSLKDKLSNMVGIIVAIGTVVSTAMDAVPDGAEVYVWAGAVLFAVFGWFTGKDGSLKSSH